MNTLQQMAQKLADLEEISDRLDKCAKGSLTTEAFFDAQLAALKAIPNHHRQQVFSEIRAGIDDALRAARAAMKGALE